MCQADRGHLQTQTEHTWRNTDNANLTGTRSGRGRDRGDVDQGSSSRGNENNSGLLSGGERNRSVLLGKEKGHFFFLSALVTFRMSSSRVFQCRAIKLIRAQPWGRGRREGGREGGGARKELE